MDSIHTAASLVHCGGLVDCLVEEEGSERGGEGEGDGFRANRAACLAVSSICK